MFKKYVCSLTHDQFSKIKTSDNIEKSHKQCSYDFRNNIFSFERLITFLKYFENKGGGVWYIKKTTVIEYYLVIDVSS